MALLAGEILAIIWIVLNTICFAPYACYQTSIYYKHKTKPFIFNRKPDMVLSFCISCLITITFVMPLCYGWEIFSNKKLNTQHYGYIIILYFLAATFFIGFWRAWHVWFDAQYKMEAATNTWAKHLNNSESDMFLRYKSTFGNPKWTKKYLITIAVILTCIFAVVIWQQQFIVIEGIICMSILLTFIGLLFLIRRLSRVKDEILLRKEYILFASFGCLYGVVFAILFIMSHNWGGRKDPEHIEVLYDALYLMIPSPILYGLILIQTQWVMFQYNKRIEMENTKLKNGNSSRNKSEDMTQDNQIMVNLKDIMSDFEGYKVFMEYLVKCVSAENLLYVSEVIQYMRDLTKKYNVKASSVQLQTYFDQYCIPKVLPKSAIMTNIDATSIRFLRLCEKYILERSEFEINISHKHRKNLVNMYRLLESRINELNPKINKLASLFGKESDFVASRRASHTKYSHTEDDVNINRQHHKNQSSNKISHSCIEDFQLLSNTDEIIQQIYDYLCYTLGDVYTNLNDGCMRFMQTDIYFRWYKNNFKKEQVLKEEDEYMDESSEDKNKNKDTELDMQPPTQLQTDRTYETVEIKQYDNNETQPIKPDNDDYQEKNQNEQNINQQNNETVMTCNPTVMDDEVDEDTSNTAGNVDEQETIPMNKKENESD
eukprot:153469_1